jgi:ATP-binding cassette subfamily F protein 3
MARRLKEYEAQQEFINRTEEFIRKYKAGQRAREAKGRATRLARLPRLQRPQENEKLRLSIASDLRSGRVVLGTDELRIGYKSGGSELELVRTPELEVQRGDRVALIGPNGGGKTTLLRTLLGDVPTLAGRFYFGTNVRPAYYAQGHESLPLDRTALETILEGHPMSEESARNLLGRFLFSEDDVFKQVAALSGGERSRLALAKLTLARANFLILDEPTNHLDIMAREALEGVLDEYDGTLLIVSHDRYFIDKLATQVWAIGDDRRIRPFLGNYTDFVRAEGYAAKAAPVVAKATPEQKVVAAPVATIASPATNGSTNESREDRRQRGGEERRRRERQKQLTETEKQIGSWEERLNQIGDEMTAAGAQGAVDRLGQLSQEYERLHEQLEGLYARWSQLNAELDELAAVATS